VRASEAIQTVSVVRMIPGRPALPRSSTDCRRHIAQLLQNKHS
jgi:hypothetical protein